jgi:hypothetical protein
VYQNAGQRDRVNEDCATATAVLNLMWASTVEGDAVCFVQDELLAFDRDYDGPPVAKDGARAAEGRVHRKRGRVESLRKSRRQLATTLAPPMVRRGRRFESARELVCSPNVGSIPPQRTKLRGTPGSTASVGGLSRQATDNSGAAPRGSECWLTARSLREQTQKTRQ